LWSREIVEWRNSGKEKWQNKEMVEYRRGEYTLLYVC